MRSSLKNHHGFFVLPNSLKVQLQRKSPEAPRVHALIQKPICSWGSCKRPALQGGASGFKSFQVGPCTRWEGVSGDSNTLAFSLNLVEATCTSGCGYDSAVDVRAQKPTDALKTAGRRLFFCRWVSSLGYESLLPSDSKPLLKGPQRNML